MRCKKTICDVTLAFLNLFNSERQKGTRKSPHTKAKMLLLFELGVNGEACELSTFQIVILGATMFLNLIGVQICPTRRGFILAEMKHKTNDSFVWLLSNFQIFFTKIVG